MNKIYQLFSNYPKRTVYIPLVIYWIILLSLTSIPSKSLPHFALSDKLNHFLAYAVLAFLIYLALYFSKRFSFNPKRIFLITLSIVAFYGLVDEIHQIFIPGRYAELLDWVADFVGSLLGAIIAYQIVLKGNKNNLEK